MGNNYRLEYELIKKSRITNRAPSSITTDPKVHIDGFDKCECGCRNFNNYINFSNIETK